MKRKELIRILESKGCYLHRYGANHDIYSNPMNGSKAAVPSHNEIKNTIVLLILKQLGLPKSFNN
ncbi:MAG: YcfA family protein [Ignavibacteria bacterium]|nr:YcfA family protein [Ignavibacteria bacterium]